MAVPKLKVSCNTSTVYVVDIKKNQTQTDITNSIFCKYYTEMRIICYSFLKMGTSCTGANAIFIHSGRILEGKT